ncbi:hypothetical protein GGX14DRAFT_366278 [Mycena pura]|uniref:Uncharacterized protein n=1 Tax=Mycena pura TaxID=153505 RepID=A0AAD6VHN9_9AGAR|nr:hypothetical protein GGX14DRAFT_366278 [Mycena pura]
MTWDGFPDRRFRCHFTSQQVEDTSRLAVYWISDKVSGGKRGSLDPTTPEKGRSSRFKCAGVTSCEATVCTVRIAPGTNIARQTESLCKCGSPLHHRSCPVEWSVVFYRAGAIFENSGTHSHPRYTHSLPTSRNKKTAPQLQHFIARKPIVLQSFETRRSLHSHSSSQTSNVGQSGDVQSDSDEGVDWTVGVHWMDDINVIVLQSPWQRRMGLKDHIKTEAVNSIVSDACHDYFIGHNQLLFLSSTYEPFHLKSWTPILMTYSNGATAVHYRIHFLYLFRGLAARCREIKRKVTDELFANVRVVDFSDAQRNGFIQAFVDFWLEFAPHGRNESKLSRAAAALVKGCRQHFDNQITRVAKISRIVGPEVDWNDLQVIFICQGCRPRKAAQLCVPAHLYFSISYSPLRNLGRGSFFCFFSHFSREQLF